MNAERDGRDVGSIRQVNQGSWPRQFGSVMSIQEAPRDVSQWYCPGNHFKIPTASQVKFPHCSQAQFFHVVPQPPHKLTSGPTTEAVSDAVVAYALPWKYENLSPVPSIRWERDPVAR